MGRFCNDSEIDTPVSKQLYVENKAKLSQLTRADTFEFIKAVSDTVYDMINVAYYDKPLILTGLYV